LPEKLTVTSCPKVDRAGRRRCLRSRAPRRSRKQPPPSRARSKRSTRFPPPPSPTPALKDVLRPKTTPPGHARGRPPPSGGLAGRVARGSHKLRGGASGRSGFVRGTRLSSCPQPRWPRQVRWACSRPRASMPGDLPHPALCPPAPARPRARAPVRRCGNRRCREDLGFSRIF